MTDPSASTAMLLPEETPPEAIVFWVIYSHPKDYPDSHVLRPQFSVRTMENPERYGVVTSQEPGGQVIASKQVWVCDTLEQCRALVPEGCILFKGDPDPAIAEVWMQ